MIKKKLKPCKRCGDPCYLFSGGMCRNCWGMTKVQEQREQPTLSQTDDKPAKPFRVIKPVSDKQAKLNKAYMVLRNVHLKNHPYCEAKITGCTSIGTDIHYIRSRGEFLLDSTHFMTVCRFCHDYIHPHHQEAKDLGFIKNRLSKQ